MQTFPSIAGPSFLFIASNRPAFRKGSLKAALCSSESTLLSLAARPLTTWVCLPFPGPSSAGEC